MLLQGKQFLMNARLRSKPSLVFVTSRSVIGHKSLRSLALPHNTESTSFISKAFQSSVTIEKLQLAVEKTSVAALGLKHHHELPSPVSKLLDVLDHVRSTPVKNAAGFVLLADDALQLGELVGQARSHVEQNSALQVGLFDGLDELLTVVKEGLTEWDKLLAQWEALAQCGQLVSLFRGRVARKLRNVGIYSWPQLAAELYEERFMAPELCSYTKALKRALGEMGFSWDDWLVMNSIAGVRNDAFHPNLDIKEVAKEIKSAPMPKGVEGVREVMNKVAQELLVAARS